MTLCALSLCGGAGGGSPRRFKKNAARRGITIGGDNDERGQGVRAQGGAVQCILLTGGRPDRRRVVGGGSWNIDPQIPGVGRDVATTRRFRGGRREVSYDPDMYDAYCVGDRSLASVPYMEEEKRP